MKLDVQGRMAQMKKIKYFVLIGILLFLGQSKVQAYRFSCTYEDTKNSKVLYYNLETTNSKGIDGVSEVFYYDNNQKHNINLQCFDTSDGCLYSLGIMTRAGALSCPSIYVHNESGQYTTTYMGETMPYSEVKISGYTCDYPNCNYYEQEDISVPSEDTKPENKKESTEEEYRATLDNCGLTDIPVSLPIFVSRVINLIKVLVPIILVVMGMIDFARATISSDEKQMKESQSRLVRRFLSGAIVFFIIAIVQFVFSAIGQSDSMIKCIACFASGDCTTTTTTTVTPVNQPACYVCISGSHIKLWTGTNPGNSSECPAGYYKSNIEKESCGIKACYQCNGRGDIYKWSVDGSDDAACGSGYHLINRSEEDCHS